MQLPLPLWLNKLQLATFFKKKQSKNINSKVLYKGLFKEVIIMDSTQGNEIVTVNINDIVIGERIRKVFSEEELSSLKESIDKDGLLQPIVINQDNKLIAGHRRYACCKELGHKTIQARRIETKGELHEALIEIRENVEREDFTFSEKMRAAEVIEPIILKKAEERMKNKNASNLTEFGIDLEKGKTRDIMGKILDLGSGKTYEQAKKVWEAKDKNLLTKLNENKIKINRAYTLVAGKKPKKAVPEADAAAVVKENEQGIKAPQEDTKPAKVDFNNMLDVLDEAIDTGEYNNEELQEVYERMTTLINKLKGLIG